VAKAKRSAVIGKSSDAVRLGENGGHKNKELSEKAKFFSLRNRLKNDQIFGPRKSSAIKVGTWTKLCMAIDIVIMDFAKVHTAFMRRLLTRVLGGEIRLPCLDWFLVFEEKT